MMKPAILDGGPDSLPAKNTTLHPSPRVKTVIRCIHWRIGLIHSAYFVNIFIIPHKHEKEVVNNYSYHSGTTYDLYHNYTDVQSQPRTVTLDHIDTAAIAAWHLFCGLPRIAAKNTSYFTPAKITELHVFMHERLDLRINNITPAIAHLLTTTSPAQKRA